MSKKQQWLEILEAHGFIKLYGLKKHFGLINQSDWKKKRKEFDYQIETEEARGLDSEALKLECDSEIHDELEYEKHFDLKTKEKKK